MGLIESGLAPMLLVVIGLLGYLAWRMTRIAGAVEDCRRDLWNIALQVHGLKMGLKPIIQREREAAFAAILERLPDEAEPVRADVKP